MLKDAITELINANADGITNSEAASVLGLRSDYRGRQKDYLSYSVLGLLMRDGKGENAVRDISHVTSRQPDINILFEDKMCFQVSRSSQAQTRCDFPSICLR